MNVLERAQFTLTCVRCLTRFEYGYGDLLATAGLDHPQAVQCPVCKVVICHTMPLPSPQAVDNPVDIFVGALAGYEVMEESQ